MPPDRAARTGVSQADEMTPSGERRHPLVGLVAIDQMFEMVERNKLQQLRKDCLSVVRDRASSARKTGDDRASRGPTISNRPNPPLAGKVLQESLCAC